MKEQRKEKDWMLKPFSLTLILLFFSLQTTPFPVTCPCRKLISATSAFFTEKPTLITVELAVNSLGPISVSKMVSTEL